MTLLPQTRCSLSCCLCFSFTALIVPSKSRPLTAPSLQITHLRYQANCLPAHLEQSPLSFKAPPTQAWPALWPYFQPPPTFLPSSYTPGLFLMPLASLLSLRESSAVEPLGVPSPLSRLLFRCFVLEEVSPAACQHLAASCYRTHSLVCQRSLRMSFLSSSSRPARGRPRSPPLDLSRVRFSPAF